MLQKINETAQWLKEHAEGEMPAIGIILGTGLGAQIGRASCRERV